MKPDRKHPVTAGLLATLMADLKGAKLPTGESFVAPPFREQTEQEALHQKERAEAKRARRAAKRQR